MENSFFSVILEQASYEIKNALFSLLNDPSIVKNLKEDLQHTPATLQFNSFQISFYSVNDVEVVKDLLSGMAMNAKCQ